MALKSRLQAVCLLMIFFLSCTVSAIAQAAQEEIKVKDYRIDGVTWQQTDDGWLLTVQGNEKPTYTQYELFSPHRVIIDIANGMLPGKNDLPLEMDNGPVTLVKGSLLVDQDPLVVRFELYLTQDSPFSVYSTGNNILVKFIDEDQKERPKPADTVLSITDITLTDEGEATRIFLQGTGPIQSYESVEHARKANQPARLVVEIANVACEDRVVPAPDNSPFAMVRTEKYNNGTRVFIDSAEEDLFRYAITAVDDGLVIMVEATETDSAPILADITGVTADEIAVATQQPAVAAELTPLERAAAASDVSAESRATTSQETDGDSLSEFAFAGYTKQKISVDFFKIDLHNVFRLIGDISGRNIVVDEAVGGSLTLTLTDVPWDFVLDVIINLKDLAKEDRFNTIVISKKSDSFTWPEGGVEDTLDIKSGQDAISVTKRLDVPREKLEARSFIRQAKSLESAGNYSGALALYEKAFQFWSDNGKLAKKIAVLAQARLGLNAKAAHYGKIASKLLPRDTGVALQTALSLANLEKVKEAQGYFDLAISDENPSRHALSSYAAFSEQNESYPMALSLFNQYEKLYGASLQTSVSKARIFDKTGNTEMADAEYRTILLSGYNVPGDLEKYIKARLKKSEK